LDLLLNLSFTYLEVFLLVLWISLLHFVFLFEFFFLADTCAFFETFLVLPFVDLRVWLFFFFLQEKSGLMLSTKISSGVE
jgi:hypothetical protein